MKTDAASYRVDIYRIGFYGGAGARLIASITPTTAVKAPQPECLSEKATGHIDCGNWHVSASWTVPKDAVSGLFVGRLVRGDTGGASHMPFIVRHDERRSDVLVQLADTTWHAYNDYGGNSLYSGLPENRAYKVSYNRPLITRGNQYSRVSFWANAYPTLRWLEANGYDVTYSSGFDTDQRPQTLGRHKVFLSLGHDEYWSEGQRKTVTAARDAGTNLAFISGNTMFWRTRWEPSIDASATPGRTLVVYKDTHSNRRMDPSSAPTSTWRDPRFGTAGGSGRPENEVTGSFFVVNCCQADSVVVSAEEGRRRFWRNTELARQPAGGSMTVGKGIVGFEWDADVDNGFRPAGLFRMSTTTVSGASQLADNGNLYLSWLDPVSHHILQYRHASGALVFSTATVNWGWALDPVHDDPDKFAAPVDVRIQQGTMNVLADMGVQPATRLEGLVEATPSTDHTSPVAVISAPAAGYVQTVYREVVIEGTATDEGGVPAGVEVSVDDGRTWHPATGVGRWTYAYRPMVRGFTTVVARAVDDSGNIQTEPAWVLIEVKGLGLGRLARIAGGIAGGFLVAVVGVWWWVRRRRKARFRAT